MSSPTAAPAPTTPTTPSSPPSNATTPPPSTPSAPPPASPTPPTPTPTPPTPSPPSPAAPPPSSPSVPTPATPAASPPAPSSSTPPATPTPSAPSPSGSSPAPPSDTPSPPSPPSSGGGSRSSPPSPPSSGGGGDRSPPSSSHSPPKSHSPGKSGGGGGSGPSTSLVVGVAVGGLVLLLLASFICLCCLRKKRRRVQHPPPHQQHYGYPPPPPPPPYKEDPYGGTYQSWQQNAPPPPPPEHVVKMHPSPPPAYANRPPQPPPPPPPAMLNSSGGSGSNYSGGEILPPPSPGAALGFSSKSTFTYEELLRATDGFSDANLLGQGGFGYVHRGMLPNGKEIAVKQLKLGSGQGEREFQAEVEIISRVHHKHLVSLVGYCISGGKRLLVYEFVPNNTLEFHLHAKDRPTMEWPTRLKIALGAAKGLAYLHEDCHPKIIHRDIKASNILLDFKFEAKVADFGLAKFTTDNNTHVSTRVMGTFGYLAPEYASSGKLTEKSDVFSYGVMLLELITGRRPVDTTQTYMDDSLVDWARPLLMRALEDGEYDALVDPRLGKNFNPNEIARMIACAAACVRHSARRRPRMSQVVRALEGDVSLDDLNEGVRPGHSRFFGSYSSSDYDSGQYNEDMKKFRKMAFNNTTTSSQYSAPTSEYGQIPSASSSEGHQTQEMESGAMKKSGYSAGYSSGYSGAS